MSSSWTYRGWFSGTKRNRNRIPISISKHSIEHADTNKMSTTQNLSQNKQPDLIEQFNKISLNEPDRDLNNNIVKPKPSKPPPAHESFFFKRTSKKKSQSNASEKSKSQNPKLSEFLLRQKNNLLNCCDETASSLSKSSSVEIINLKSNESARSSPCDLSSLLEEKKKEWSKLNCNLVDSHCHFEMIFNRFIIKIFITK